MKDKKDEKVYTFTLYFNNPNVDQIGEYKETWTEKSPYTNINYRLKLDY